MTTSSPEWCRGECSDPEWCLDWHDCLVPHPDTLRNPMTGEVYGERVAFGCDDEKRRTPMRRNAPPSVDRGRGRGAHIDGLVSQDPRGGENDTGTVRPPRRSVRGPASGTHNDGPGGGSDG